MLLLIYCIATRQTVDIGQVIVHQIKYFQLGKNASIIFPSLITQLCMKRRKFPKVADNELLMCPTNLTLTHLQQLKRVHYYTSLETFMNNEPVGSAVAEEERV